MSQDIIKKVLWYQNRKSSFCKKIKKKICFENLTLAPIENDLINYNLLTKLEKNYLFKYHLNVYSKLSKYLSLNERKWLASYI